MVSVWGEKAFPDQRCGSSSVHHCSLYCKSPEVIRIMWIALCPLPGSVTFSLLGAVTMGFCFLSYLENFEIPDLCPVPHRVKQSKAFPLPGPLACILSHKNSRDLGDLDISRLIQHMLWQLYSERRRRD